MIAGQDTVPGLMYRHVAHYVAECIRDNTCGTAQRYRVCCRVDKELSQTSRAGPLKKAQQRC